MPLYEYECEKCGHVTEAHRAMRERRKLLRCEVCGGKTEKLITSTHLTRIPFPFTLDHVAEHPVTFKSKREMRKYLDKRGLASPVFS